MKPIDVLREQGEYAKEHLPDAPVVHVFPSVEAEKDFEKETPAPEKQ